MSFSKPENTGRLIAAFGVAILAGCTSVPSDPDRHSLEPATVSHLRSAQTLAIVNTYTAPAVVKVNQAGWTADFQKLTETAAAMLRRAMEKQGITVAAESDRKIGLRVLRAAAAMGGGPMMTMARIQLGAQFGDGTRIVVEAENTGFSGERALDGAVLFALNKLVVDEKFVAYVNSSSMK